MYAVITWYLMKSMPKEVCAILDFSLASGVHTKTNSDLGKCGQVPRPDINDMYHHRYFIWLVFKTKKILGCHTLCDD